MPDQKDKQEVAELVKRWIARAGLQKKQAASRAGMDYQSFYRAYLDPNRPVKHIPEQTIAVVSAFVERCTEQERCRADEAIRFCSLAQLPIDRFEMLRPLFPEAEWREALSAYQAGDAAPKRRAPTPPSDEAIPAPGQLPAPYRMPYARNPLFQGRAGALRELARILLGQAAAEQSAAIVGIGGVGKTNLATEFAYRYGQHFPGGVFWLNCADPQTLPAELAACGGAGLSERGDWSRLPLDDQVRLVQLAWQAPIARLLVFDNCEEEELLRMWRPASGGCRVLLTSRRESWPRTLGVATVPLRELERAESIALLQRYRPDLAPGSADLAALAAELGDLPLALHLAGSYLDVNQHDPPFGDPAALLRDLRAAGPLDHEALTGVDSLPSATEHDPHLKKTFLLGLERLVPGDPTDALAQRLLSRVGQLAPNTPFPRDLLPTTLGIAREDAEAARPALRALRRLVALGFLHQNEKLVFVHPLVAAFARGVGDAEAARADVERALIGAAEVAYPEDVQALRAIQPHMRQLAEAAQSRHDELAARLCNTFPFLLEIAGDLAGGLPYFEHARAVLAQAGRLETQLGAEVLNNLAEWSRTLGDVPAARGFHEQALAIRRRILPPGDSDIAQSANNLAELLREEAAYDEARSYYEQALAIWSRQFGPDHAYTLSTRSNIGLLLYDQGRYAEAEAHLAAVLASALAGLGPESTYTARAHFNLGKALGAQGHHEQASAQLEAALAIFREKLGDEHLDTLRTRHQLALLAGTRGQRRNIVRLLRELLAVCERVLGPDFPLTQGVRADLKRNQ